MSSLTVVVGPMASGKTMRLIELLRRAELAGDKVLLFKHKIDSRDGDQECASRFFGLKWDALSVDGPEAIDDVFFNTKFGGYADVIGIEEGQFFGHELPVVVRGLMDSGVNVIVTGLNQNYRGEPFGCMPELMAMADKLELLTAVCSCCGRSATRTQRLIDSDEEFLVGGDAEYEPRCPACWERPV